MYQLDFSMFDDTVDIVFSNRALPSIRLWETVNSLGKNLWCVDGFHGTNLVNDSTGRNPFLALETLLEGIV